MYPEKKGGSHKMARPQQNWGLLTLLTRWASIWTMPNTASPKSEPPCGRAVYNPVRVNILGHPPQKTAPGGTIRRSYAVSFVSSYRNTSNIRRAFVGNKIVDHSDVFGASPVSAAPPTSSFSTSHMASIYIVLHKDNRKTRHETF